MVAEIAFGMTGIYQSPFNGEWCGFMPGVPHKSTYAARVPKCSTDMNDARREAAQAEKDRDEWERRAFQAAEEARELRDALEELYGASDEPHALRCPTNRYDRPESECNCGVEAARVILYGMREEGNGK